MKYAIIGSRNFCDYELMEKTLKEYDISEIISGGAKGADSLAARYADQNDISLVVFKADWKRYGRAAGVIRNTDIIDSSDVVIAFWDGVSRGTKNSIDKAIKAGKSVNIIDVG